MSVGVLKTTTPKTPKTSKTPKTLKLENKDPPYYGGLRNYDQAVANAIESWALATRILRLLLASLTGIGGNWFRFHSKKIVFCFKQETYLLSLRRF